MKNGYYFLLLTLSCIFPACDSDNNDDPGPIENPTFYSFERNGSSTVNFSGQTTRIGMATELINDLKDFSETETHLLELFANQTSGGGDANPFANAEYNASTKSIKSKVAASRDFFSGNTTESATIKADFETWISAQVTEVFPNEMTLAAPGVAGQIADGISVRYVNAKGLEYNQAVNKSLIGALMVDQMLNNYLSSAVLDESDNREKNDAGTPANGKSYTTMEHKWDEAYGYLFGFSADPANPLVTLGDDNFLNKYVRRVNNDPDFEGIAQGIFDAFKLGRAAIVAGEYEVRDMQAGAIRDLVSKVVAARAVYYLQQGKNGLPSSGNNFGPAFHDLSEGFGFVYSLRFLRQPKSFDPYFTRAEVDGFLDQLTAGNGFWDITPETLDQISEAIADKFDFSVAMAGS